MRWNAWYHLQIVVKADWARGPQSIVLGIWIMSPLGVPGELRASCDMHDIAMH